VVCGTTADEADSKTSNQIESNRNRLFRILLESRSFSGSYYRPIGQALCCEIDCDLEIEAKMKTFPLHIMSCRNFYGGSGNLSWKLEGNGNKINNPGNGNGSGNCYMEMERNGNRKPNTSTLLYRLRPIISQNIGPTFPQKLVEICPSHFEIDRHQGHKRDFEARGRDETDTSSFQSETRREPDYPRFFRHGDETETSSFHFQFEMRPRSEP